jgi:hypothetical protein
MAGQLSQRRKSARNIRFIFPILGNVVGQNSALGAVRSGASVARALALGESHAAAASVAVDAAATFSQLATGGSDCDCKR